jgi:uroporphyrinogen-III synthase
MPSAQFDSEGLLAQPELKDVAEQRILIVRGQGGREFLAETLRARGAIVDYAEVYKRLPTKQVLTYEPGDIDVILITSSEALSHLASIASQQGNSWLLEKPLLVLHERIAMRAKQLGFKLKPDVAKQASEASLLEALHLI